MSQASQTELLMLELINEERTSRGLDPLEINNRLNEASEDHSEWMLDSGTFSHQGENGSSHRDRIEAANYELEGSWRTAENIGWQSERGAPGIEDDVRDIHQALMESPGHRANILNPELEDIGIGIEEGDFRGFEAVMITQKFGTSAAENGPTAPAAPPEEPDVPVADLDPPADREPPVVPPADPVTPVADVDPPEDPTPPPVPPETTPPTRPDPSDPPTPDPFDFGSFFEDVFDFRVPTVPDAMDAEMTTGFEGRITVNGETVRTEDPVEFDLLARTLFEGFGDMICGLDFA
ncbi:MAG: CAP domain-containing protein [Pseudomonadota bacterium]